MMTAEGLYRLRAICQRLFRFVVAKLGEFEEKVMNEDKRERKKLIKPRIRERETVITLDNGTTSGQKKRLHNKGTTSERSPKQQIARPDAGKSPQPHRGLVPLINDINKKSDAFIENTLEKMRKSL